MAAVNNMMSRRWMRSETTFQPGPRGTPEPRMVPAPNVPLHPVVSVATFTGAGPETAPAIVDHGEAEFVTAGRIAIARALQLMDIRAGDEVLVPAYHCPAMTEPIVWLSSVPVFYRLNEDLTPDLADAARKVTPRTRAIMGVHFFGFPQPLDELRGFADVHRLKLIEDCSHSFFGSWHGRPLGSAGDFTIGSLTKFFPVRDGGCLIVASQAAEVRHPNLRAQGAFATVRASLDTVEDSIEFSRLSGLAPASWAMRRAKRAVRRVLPAEPNESTNPAQRRSGAGGEFDGTWIDVRISSPSLVIARRAARARIVSRRRRHYRRLTEALTGIRGSRPINTDLPEGVVPYMFPFWIDDLERRFPIFEDRAIPMHRFGQFLSRNVDESICRVSVGYARNLLQLPCHQELNDDEIEHIIDLVRGALAA